MIVGRERRKRGVQLCESNSSLRIDIYRGGQAFDVVTLQAKPGEPDPRPEWIADYNRMMGPLGMNARLPTNQIRCSHERTVLVRTPQRGRGAT